jgi:hypothetical protein
MSSSPSSDIFTSTPGTAEPTQPFGSFEKSAFADTRIHAGTSEEPATIVEIVSSSAIKMIIVRF